MTIFPTRRRVLAGGSGVAALARAGSAGRPRILRRVTLFLFKRRDRSYVIAAELRGIVGACAAPAMSRPASGPMVRAGGLCEIPLRD